MADDGKISIVVTPSYKGFRTDLRSFLAKMEAENNLNINVQLGETEKVKAQLDKLIAEQSRKKIKIDIDEEKFGAKLNKASQAMSGFGSMAGSALKSLALFGAAGGAVSGIAQVTNAMVTLSGSLLVLPGALLSAGLGIGTLAIGLHGFGDALKASGDPAKFSAALKGLAPNAAAAAVAIHSFAPAFTALRLDVQQQLFAGLAAQIKTLGASYLPILRTGFAGFAVTLNDAAKSVGSFFSQAQTQTDLASVFNTGQAAAFNLSGALVPVLSILRDIGTVSAGVFADITAGAGGAAQRMADFVSQARASGELAQFIQAGVQAFSALAGTLSNVVKIIATVSQGLGGGGGLFGILEQVTGAMLGFLRSAAGTQALAALGTIFSAVGKALSGVLLAALTQLAKILVDNAPAIAAFATAFGKDLVDAINNVGPLLDNIIKTILKLPPGVLAGIAVGVVGLAAAFALLSPVVAIVAAVTAAVGAIGGIATIAVLAAGVAIALLITYWKPISGFFVGIAKTVAGAFTGTMSAIGDAFGAAASFVVGIWNGIVGFFTGIGTAISNAFIAVGVFITGVFSGIGTFVSGVVISIGNFFAALPGRIATFLAGIPAAFITALNAAAYAVGFAIGTIIKFFIDLPANIATGLANLGAFLGNLFITALTAVGVVVLTGITNLVTFFFALPGKILKAVESLNTSFQNFLATVWVNAVQAVSTGISNVISFVNALPGRVISGVSSLLSSIGTFFRNVWNGAATAVQTGIATVIAYFHEMPGRALAEVVSLAGKLFDAGKNIVQGLINGIGDLVGKLVRIFKDAAGSAISGFLAAFGVHSPSRVMYSAGVNIVAGLVNGISDRAGQFQDAMGSLAQAGLDGFSPVATVAAAVSGGIAVTTNGDLGATAASSGSGSTYNIYSPSVDTVAIAMDVDRQKNFALRGK